jgi:AcrR family transcriptional regulator
MPFWRHCAAQWPRPQAEPVPGREKPAAASAPQPRINDPERTIAEIIGAATHEFSEKGLAGARVDVIATAMRTSKRMIYYYFGSKEGLYIAVLEEAYRNIRAIEASLNLDDLPPDDALRKLVGFTVDHQLANPHFVRLLMAENIHRGEYLAQSRGIQLLKLPAIDGLRKVYERGLASGLFRGGVDMIDLHMSISALSMFNVANGPEFSVIFKRDLQSPAALIARRDSVIEMVLRFVRR